MLRYFFKFISCFFVVSLLSGFQSRDSLKDRFEITLQAQDLSEMPTVLPSALKKDDLIALVFPASFIDKSDEEADRMMQSKSAFLQSQGFQTIFYPDHVQREGYLAGSDVERASALMEAWKNEEVKAIWCFRGGYGSQRILEYLDYDFIQTHPKILIGMSDITALHQAIQQKTGLVTFLGPVFMFFDEGEFDTQYALSSFEQILVNQWCGEIIQPIDLDFRILRPGKAAGKLVGGNLSLISSLCGTKWQLNTDGKILLLEEVNDPIYKVDRAIWQLKEAGLLDRPAAVILASWTHCEAIHKYSLTLEQIFEHYFQDASYPVILGIPSGHINTQAMLPLNQVMELDTDKKTLRIFEPAVKAR